MQTNFVISNKTRLFDTAKLQRNFDITKLITVIIIFLTQFLIMNLREYYQSVKNQPSPAADFVAKIASLCNRKEITVRKWLAGDAVPPAHLQEKISRYLDIPVKELFPESLFNNKRIK